MQEGVLTVSGGVIQLDLERLRGAVTVAGIPHSFLDEALGALHEWLSRIGDHFCAEACSQVDQCRAALQAELPSDQLRPLLDDTLSAVTTALTRNVRATIFSPRSCPSNPILARSTRRRDCSTAALTMRLQAQMTRSFARHEHARNPCARQEPNWLF